MIRRLLARLDAYTMDHPSNNEGHPEDRCCLCEAPIVDHPCWQHRRHAIIAWTLGAPI